jgi:hypothetical protein
LIIYMAQALNHHRPVVATFHLFDRPKDSTSVEKEEWNRFAEFFYDPGRAAGVLTAADVLRTCCAACG